MNSTLRSASDPILFLSKRFYTNKDAWKERFGRIFRLPLEWSKSGEDVLLWLLDDHSRESVAAREGRFALRN